MERCLKLRGGLKMGLFHKTLMDAKRKVEAGDINGGQEILEKHYKDALEGEGHTKQIMNQLLVAFEDYEKNLRFGFMYKEGRISESLGGEKERKRRTLSYIQHCLDDITIIKSSFADLNKGKIKLK